MILGLLSPCRGCMRKCSVAGILSCLVSWCHAQSENGGFLNWGPLNSSAATRLATLLCIGATISTVNLERLLPRLWDLGVSEDRGACMYKDQGTRPRIEVHVQGSRCKNKDQGARTRIKVHVRGLRCMYKDQGTKTRIEVHLQGSRTRIKVHVQGSRCISRCKNKDWDACIYKD